MSGNITQTKPLTYEQWSHILCHHYTGNLIITETDLLFKRIRDAVAPVNDVPMCIVMAFRSFYSSEYQKRKPATIKRDCWQVRLREANRTRILNAILTGKKTATEIMAVVDLSRSNICHKLFELEHQGVITRRRKGIGFAYTVVPVKAAQVAA